MSKMKKLPKASLLTPDCLIADGHTTCPKTAEEPKEPGFWTLISALDIILDAAEDSKLSDEFWELVKPPLDYLTERLGLTNVQIVVLAMLIEAGNPLSFKDMGHYLNMTRLSVMVYSEEIEELVTKRWAVRKGSRDMSGYCEGFALVSGVVNALRHNEVFVPEKIDGLTEQQFVDKLENYVRKHIHNHDSDLTDDEDWMLQLVKANPQLPLCQEVMKLDDIHQQSLLLLAVVDYAEWEGSEVEGLTLELIDDVYPEDIECDFLRFELKDGSHPLIEKGYIEHKCVDGQADTEKYVLTRKTKSELLAAYSPSHTLSRRVARGDDNLLKSHNAIKEKSLFYNTAEQEQIERLTSLLSTENLPSIQQRLEQQGLRKGFACLFYGSPGTGKTETVLQIARKTGRDLMEVDIAGMRDKFVGESEKNIKAVFTRYRALCKNSEVMPILFFNEADGIFGKRTTVGGTNPSLEKMENAMQNIILQELEALDGILIATTNLTCNLDSAFERRFIYKVEFHKPGTDVKAKIWRTMLNDLSSDDARQLATRFDFSGGQIENIARKRAVDYILSGKLASLSEIEGYCRAELLTGKERKSIGFVKPAS